MNLLCSLGIHATSVPQFVGDSWNPDLYIKICPRCGVQRYE